MDKTAATVVTGNGAPADEAQRSFQAARQSHWDSVARRPDSWWDLSRYYHRRLVDVYRFLVPPGQSMLELGCGQGDLLAALEPLSGVGVDFSAEMIARARARHPSLEFVHADVHDLRVDRTFDVVILSDLVNDSVGCADRLRKSRSADAPTNPDHPEPVQPPLGMPFGARNPSETGDTHASTELVNR